eukprot:jgi/Ulvmu1/12112/UM084_0038.1
MPKGKKGKKDELVEPEHDKTWERAVQCQQWTLEPTALPDAFAWPTWGALRERILHACKLIQCEHSATVRDAFAAELVKLSPPRLATLSFCGCPNLHRFVLSPINACPSMVNLNLSCCSGLEYVFVQSMSLQIIDLSNCPNVTKAIIHAPNSLKITLKNCPKLSSIHVWSDQLTQLIFDGCTGIQSLVCRCDKLSRVSHPPLVEVLDKSKRPDHKPVRDIVLDRRAAELQTAAAKCTATDTLEANPASIPAVYRAPVPGQ